MQTAVVTEGSVAERRPTQMADAFQNLQRAISQCEDVIFFADATGVISRVNPAFERLMGYSSVEIVGKDMSCITEGGAQSEQYQAIWRHIFQQRQFKEILKLKTKSGELQELDLTITPLHSRGHLASLVATGHSRSSLKSEGRKQMPDAGTARMLHDFNNILQIAVGHTDLAMGRLPSDHPARRHLENSKSVAQSAAALLHEFTCGNANWEGVPLLSSNRLKTAEPRACARSTPLNSSLPQSAEPATILLVEDESLILDSSTELLRAAGYNVLSAGTGGDALDMIQAYKGPIDLLVTDLALPQINGSELAVAIAASHPETRVLAVSGHPEEYVCGQPGIGEYLAKPFSFANLHDKIRSLLSEKKPAQGRDAGT